MQENMTYEQALERLNKLTAGMENGTIGIDQMAEQLQEAQQLLEYCKGRLLNAEKKCNSLLNVEEKE